MKKTVQPRKQRKRLADAPLHTRGKTVSSTLSKELKAKLKKGSLPLVAGDKVEVMRGNFRGHKGAVTEVDRKKYRVYVKGVFNKTAKGEEAPRPLNASNLRIVEAKLEDKKREKMIARK